MVYCVSEQHMLWNMLWSPCSLFTISFPSRWPRTSWITRSQRSSGSSWNRAPWSDGPPWKTGATGVIRWRDIHNGIGADAGVSVKGRLALCFVEISLVVCLNVVSGVFSYHWAWFTCWRDLPCVVQSRTFFKFKMIGVSILSSHGRVNKLWIT